MRLVRWLLVLPLALGSVYLAFILGFHLLRLSDRLCRWLELAESLCTVTWYPAAEIFIASVCGAIAMLLAALLPAWVAPSNKRAVAIGGVLVCLPIALWILVVLAFPLVLPLIFSTLAALLAVRWVSRHG